MSKARNIADLLDANGDVVSGSLDNVPPADLVNDTTPQLGGNLDLNGSDITGTGNVNVTGTITATNFVGSDLVNDTTPQLGGTLDANSNNIEFGDSSAATNNRLKFGAGPDLQIYHDGSNSYVNDTGTGNLILKGGTQVQLQASNGETALTTNDNGAVSLYYDNALRAITTSAGVGVFGDLSASNIDLNDNAKLRLGTSDDLQIYHDGTNSYVTDQGSGNLIIQGSSEVVIGTSTGQDYFKGTTGGDVKLYHNNAQKLATTATGVSITGDLSVSGSIAGAGKVLQVVSTTKTGIFSLSGHTNNWVDITGLSVSITPSSTSSKILVFGHVAGGATTQVTQTYRLRRNTTTIGSGGSGTNIRNDNEAPNVAARAWHHAPFCHLDSPSTTSAITYKLQIYDTSFSSPTQYVNRNGDSGSESVSNITVMEIAG